MVGKETKMRLEVDLQCYKCYKKVKEILCKYPQIRDQVFDEKHDTVTITVVCCNPQKLRDKICCKGRGIIKTIEILEPTKPAPPKPAPPAPAAPGQPAPRRPPALPSPPVLQPSMAVSIGVCCCMQCYQGREGGPCLHGHGWPAPCYWAYYGKPIYDSYGGGRPCYLWDEYLLCERNTSLCSVM